MCMHQEPNFEGNFVLLPHISGYVSIKRLEGGGVIWLFPMSNPI